MWINKYDHLKDYTSHFKRNLTQLWGFGSFCSGSPGYVWKCIEHTHLQVQDIKGGKTILSWTYNWYLNSTYTKLCIFQTLPQHFQDFSSSVVAVEHFGTRVSTCECDVTRYPRTRFLTVFLWWTSSRWCPFWHRCQSLYSILPLGSEILETKLAFLFFYAQFLVSLVFKHISLVLVCIWNKPS